MKLIFDIGCNDGHWIAANLKEDNFIIGIDANPDSCSICWTRFKDKYNVNILNRAIGDKDDEFIDLYVASTSWASTTSLDFKDHGRFAKVMGWNKPISVKTITIDTLIKTYGEPSYIKIDVEGSELMALKGLSKKTGMVAFEWNEEEKSNVIKTIEYCWRLGYREFALLEEDEYTYIPSAWIDYEDICDLVDNTLNAVRMSKWGMIYCK